jgi:NNP family nitrate/nitrite transporter-like MFS transporter
MSAVFSSPAIPAAAVAMPATSDSAKQGAGLQLAMATGAFAVCFAIFGSVSAMMPVLKKQMGLSTLEVSIAVAIPVLLGSLGRIPLGILTDRIGGRIVFIGVMLASVVAAFAMGFVGAYWQLLLCGLFLGISLAVFSVGIGFVSGWYPPQRQGTALGIYGAGNIGQSFAAYGSPVLASALGARWGFWSFALLTLAWLLLFAILARNAPRPAGPAKTFRSSLAPLADRMSWILSLYYFLTFGGFVAMAIYLPIFLTDMFKLTPADAGLRTAGFVILATLMRPVGGTLADRIGGRVILLGAFIATTLFAVFMACPMIHTFTIGALGMAASIGLGNGAVFKLVPQYFPKSVGAVTGLVGAAGGLGGFFPPLVVGIIKESTGSFSWGFLCLAVFSTACLFICWKTGPRAAT